MPSPEAPQAGAVVIGGGVIGLSIALHLAEAGISHVVVVERGELGSGSTCKAAGGVRASFSQPANVAMGLRGLAVYSRFAELYGQEVDFHRDGYLYLLSTPAQLAAHEQAVALQVSLGARSRMVEPAEAKRLSPLIETDGLVAAAWSPQDGSASPESVVLGYAGAVRRAGGKILRRCAALAIETKGAHVSAVVTTAGRIATRTVVCAAGAWSAQIGAMAGVQIPVVPVRRQLAVTGTLPAGSGGRALPAQLQRRAPLTVDASTGFYFHPEGRGVLFGWADPDEPVGFNLRFEPLDWLPRFGEIAQRRAPAVLEAGVATGWAGLYEVTPDHNQIVDRVEAVEGFFIAAGFSGHGFLMAPAVGELVADLVLEREPRYDLTGMRLGRFAGGLASEPERNII